MGDHWNGRDDEPMKEPETDRVRGRAEEADEFDEVTEDQDDEDIDDEEDGRY